MKTRRLSKIISVILLTILTVFPVFAENNSSSRNQMPYSIPAADLYWISYVFDRGIFLMQIDSVGNVTKTPSQVVLPKSLDLAAATTISRNGADKINLWFVANGLTIYRASINKRTLTLTKLVKTALSTTNFGVFKVTQKPQNNFIGVARESTDRDGYRDFLALGVTPTGVAKGEKWPIARNAFGIPVCCSGGSVSSDGGAATWFEKEFSSGESKLYIQLLDDSGRPYGAPQTIARDIAPYLVDVSVSNALGGGVRFVVFEALGRDPGQLFLQTVSSETGLNIGNRISLKKGILQQEATIDPLGRFVIYGRQNLMFQALDATGHNRGPAKVLVKDVRPTGIDILKN